MAENRVILKNVRISYNFLEKGQKKEVKQEKKNADGTKTVVNEMVTVYSCQLLIDKKDTKNIEALKNAIKYTIEKNKSKLVNSQGKVPSQLKTCLRDGDTDPSYEGNSLYEGKYFVNANSYKPVGLVIKKNGQFLPCPSEKIYSGSYGWVSLSLSAFDTDGNKGIKATVCNWMFTKDGERLDGQISAEDEFADADVESEIDEEVF